MAGRRNGKSINEWSRTAPSPAARPFARAPCLFPSPRTNPARSGTSNKDNITTNNEALPEGGSVLQLCFSGRHSCKERTLWQPQAKHPLCRASQSLDVQDRISIDIVVLWKSPMNAGGLACRRSRRSQTGRPVSATKSGRHPNGIVVRNKTRLHSNRLHSTRKTQGTA